MGRDHNAVIVATGVVGISVIAAMAMCRHRQRQGEETWLSRGGLLRFASNKAAVFRLHHVNRSNTHRVGGASALRCSDTGTDIPVQNLIAVPQLTLYSIEVLHGQIFLVFMEVPSMLKLFQLPFLDRGVRAVAEIGSKVYVARIEAVEKVPGFEPLHKLSPARQSWFSVVWNTGRCGSTLMHKMLQKVGVLSFTEPFWLDRICDLKMEGFDDATVARAFGVCGAMDVMLASKYMTLNPAGGDAPEVAGRGYVSFNPKGKDFMCMNSVIRALPHVRHIFMYRDARKVVESFCSIIVRPPSILDKLRRWLPFSRSGRAPLPPRPSAPAQAPPVFSRTMAELKASGAIVEPTKPLVKLISMLWIECMCSWQEIVRDRATAEGTTMSLRMADFVRKDPGLIRQVLRFVLFNAADVSEEVVALALKAFEKHSQEGDRMANSSFNPASRTPCCLTEKDKEEITALAKAVPSIGSPDYVHPNSLGANTTSLSS